jgi:hypothetical protein
MKTPQETVEDTITKIQSVGLREAWFSWSKESTNELTLWLKNQGYTVEKREWSHPESLCVENKSSNTNELEVYSVKW